MKKIEKWEAVDGTIFDTEEECINYEQNSAVVVTLNELTETFPDPDKFTGCLKLITQICKNTTPCESCLFSKWEACMLSDYPEKWDLDGITKIFTKINDGDKEPNNNENSDSRRI